MANFEDLKGKVLTNIERVGDEELIFTCKDGSKYKMYHEQDCCEDVRIEDVTGDLNDLLNSEVMVSEERTNEGETDWGSETWTFYTIRTQKASVDIRWHGESNGYYSESVDFVLADKNGNFSRW